MLYHASFAVVYAPLPLLNALLKILCELFFIIQNAAQISHYSLFPPLCSFPHEKFEHFLSSVSVPWHLYFCSMYYNVCVITVFLVRL